jgi:hypothetical protein
MRSVLLRMRNVSDKSFRENQRTFLSITVFQIMCHEIKWKNLIEPERL